MSDINRMLEMATKAYDPVFTGISKLDYLDMPNHGNIGDSAIALGTLRYFRDKAIAIASTSSIDTHNWGANSQTQVQYFHGGGNLGSLYQHHNDFRMRASIAAPKSARLILGSQSLATGIDLQLSGATVQTLKRFDTVCVRDLQALQVVRNYGIEAILVPDAVHFLGAIKSGSPTQKIKVLQRQDIESRSKTFDEGLDWPSASIWIDVKSRVRRKMAHTEKFNFLMNPTPAGWEREVQARVAKGVEFLSAGEIIVTDRLHAMLLALQMGKKVVAIQNSTNKLLNYSTTWFDGLFGESLYFEDSWNSAMSLAQRL